jgi:hypothetical protein
MAAVIHADAVGEFSSDEGEHLMNRQQSQPRRGHKALLMILLGAGFVGTFAIGRYSAHGGGQLADAYVSGVQQKSAVSAVASVALRCARKFASSGGQKTAKKLFDKGGGTDFVKNLLGMGSSCPTPGDTTYSIGGSNYAPSNSVDADEIQGCFDSFCANDKSIPELVQATCECATWMDYEYGDNIEALTNCMTRSILSSDLISCFQTSCPHYQQAWSMAHAR